MAGDDKVWYMYAYFDGRQPHKREMHVFSAPLDDVSDLRDAIWLKSEASFQRFQGIYDAGSLDLWVAEKERLHVTPKLKDVFRGQNERKVVLVTKADAENWDEQFETKPEVGKEDQKKTKKRRTEELGAIHSLKNFMFTASTLQKDNNAMKFIQQKVMNLYRDVDGAWEPEGDAPPLTILDGILAEFAADLKFCTPGEEDEQLVWEPGRAMCATFPYEKQRVEKFWEIMMEHIQIFSAFQHLKLDGGETNGSLCVSGGLLVNLEAKMKSGLEMGVVRFKMQLMHCCTSVRTKWIA